VISTAGLFDEAVCIFPIPPQKTNLRRSSAWAPYFNTPFPGHLRT
jgi:hypothetical protein